ncbi:MAG: transposase [Candidatus Sericytochromatia bacterium]|nr:transposase [Candidatus Sericytochromatia bacterium]
MLAGAGHGVATEFRDALTARHLTYLVGVQSTMTVWPPAMGPLPAKPHRGRGRPATSVRRDAKHQPLTTSALAMSLPPEAFQQVPWREGSRGTMQSRCAVVRVRPAHRDYNRQVTLFPPQRAKTLARPPNPSHTHRFPTAWFP